MFKFADPSELRAGSLLPDIGAIRCDGLEQLTGCDLVIARIPVPPVAALKLHIESRSLFVQRKSGYDTVGDINQVWLEIARMQECGIPMQQAFILPIGKFYSNSEGYLRIEGKKPIEKNKAILYKTYLKNEAAWGYSGVQVRRLNNEDELLTWIEAQMEELERIEKRNGAKEVFSKGSQIPASDDPFQEIKVVDDWRTLFLTGIPGIGLETLENIDNYRDANDHQYTIGKACYALKIITDEDEDGKPRHTVKGIGAGRRKKVRDILGLDKGFNLAVVEADWQTSFDQGWKAFGNALLYLANEKGMKAPAAFKQLMEQETPF